MYSRSRPNETHRHSRTRHNASCAYSLLIVLPWISEIQPWIREILQQTDKNNSVT